jgi:formylglycine-generating enzyme required for sulfatase activity
MTDTIALLDAADPRSDRIASSYAGVPGNWERYWTPDDEPIFPFTMGSVSLYSTPLDYARFLAFWMDNGTVGEQRLLSPQAVERALTPASVMGDSLSFPGLKVRYGQMWTVYMAADAPDRTEPVVFGHNGADGTWAWAWPDRDLIVLYFTQSRGQTTGLRLEKEIDRLLVHPRIEPEITEVPEGLKPYLGVYSAYSGPLDRQQVTVLVQNGRLALDIPSLIVYELGPLDDEDTWRAIYDETIGVVFDRDESGAVTGMKVYTGGEVSELSAGSAPLSPTATPPPSTPTPIPPTPTPIPPLAILSPPSAPALGDIWTRSTDGMEMVSVPAGEFDMGSTDAEVDTELAQCPECERDWFALEQPLHTVYLDAFWIDRTEVTNTQYRACVEAGVCLSPSTCDWGEPTFDDASKAEQPVVCVDWEGAVVYCQWVGAQLPTEAQWEKAARGPERRIYPWGDGFDGKLSNYCDTSCEHDHRDAAYDDGYAHLAPVGSYPEGVSPYGALDMAGNAWEWVSDWYDEAYYASSPGENPLGPDTGDYKAVRGGSWYTRSRGVRTANRYRSKPDPRYDLLGFRCVLPAGD